jgi:hypothetical protein
MVVIFDYDAKPFVGCYVIQQWNKYCSRDCMKSATREYRCIYVCICPFLLSNICFTKFSYTFLHILRGSEAVELSQEPPLMLFVLLLCRVTSCALDRLIL